MKRFALILLSVLLAATLWAQEPPCELCVGNTGFASWLPPSDPSGLQGYRLWLDDIELGDIDTTEYQIDIDTLQTYQEYTFSVAAVYPDEVSESMSHSFLYEPCSHYVGPAYFQGSFVDENTVELTWRNYTFEPWLYGDDFTTHPGAGYNNGWNVSALHDGLTAYGFNVNRDEGFMVMDKFDTPEGWSQGGIYGFQFYLYQDATPVSTLTGVYMAIYDGDPLDGGQLIYGNLDENIKGSTYMQHVYRTSENDFSEVNRPVACITTNVELDEILPGTYWFIATFTGRLKGGVYAVPRTVLGQTTTGETRIYEPNKGWSPLIDPGTGTQQGIAFNMMGPGTGGALPIGYTDLYRDGELIAHGIDPNEDMYIDHNVPHGIHNYSIVNVYSDPNWWECPNKSFPQTIDVRPSYEPKNFEVSMEPLNDEWTVSHLSWDKEDDIPQREVIKTFYEIYRKGITDSHFNLVGVLPKDESLESFDYLDTVPNGVHYYRINDYNVYPTGSCQSSFAGRFGDCGDPYFPLTIDGEVQSNGNTDGALVSWGNLREGVLTYNNGPFIEALGNTGDYRWGIRIPYNDQHGYTFLKNVSLFTVTEGEYEILVYEGSNNQPQTLVAQKTVHLPGDYHWHTVDFEDIHYMIGYPPLWIIVHTQGLDEPIVYGSDDGTTDDGRWVYSGSSWYKAPIEGSFMIKAHYSTLLDAEYLMQTQEPQNGYIHYNLYRSTDNVNYELIAQIPYPNYECHVEYFDPHDNPAPECYYYQLTLTFRDIDESLCETTPILNSNNPLIDWAEVCGTWNIDETIENENLALYPNPTTGLLTIAMDDFSRAEVYDLMGRLMKRSQQPTFDLGRLPQGIYVVKVFDNTGNNLIRKVIKN